MRILELDDMQWHEYCDHCGAEPLHLITCLFGVKLCSSCDAAIQRSKPKAIPMNRGLKKYLRDIESGRKPAPFKMSVTRGDKTDHLPIKLKTNGEPA